MKNQSKQTPEENSTLITITGDSSKKWESQYEEIRKKNKSVTMHVLRTLESIGLLIQTQGVPIKLSFEVLLDQEGAKEYL